MLIKNTKTVLALSFSIVILVMIVLAFIGSLILHSNTQRIDTIVHTHNLKHNITLRMRTAASERLSNLKNMIILEDPFDRDEQWELFNEQGTNFIVAYEELLKMDFSPDERVLLTEEAKSIKTTGAIQHRVAELALTYKIEEARTILMEQAIPLTQIALRGLTELMEIQNKNTSRSVQEAKQEYDETLTILILLAAGGIVICIIIASVITRRVSHTEQELKHSHDILETRVSERTQKLSQTTEYLQFVLSSTPAIIYTANAIGHLENTNFISENTRTIMGYTPEQFTENSDFWREHIHPDDLQRIEVALPELYKQGHQLNERSEEHTCGLRILTF